jgi:hypothetical protein
MIRKGTVLVQLIFVTTSMQSVDREMNKQAPGCFRHGAILSTNIVNANTFCSRH